MSRQISMEPKPQIKADKEIDLNACGPEITKEDMQSFLKKLDSLVLQQIEGNLIYPHVVGESVGLPSIWVLAAVTIGGNLMGIVGMLVFIPLLSVVYTIFRKVVYLRLKKRHIKQVTATDIEEYTEKETASTEKI